jgi:hypothetical protein
MLAPRPRPGGLEAGGTALLAGGTGATRELARLLPELAAGASAVAPATDEARARLSAGDGALVMTVTVPTAGA